MRKPFSPRGKNGFDIGDHFGDVTEMVEYIDYRYICTSLILCYVPAIFLSTGSFTPLNDVSHEGTFLNVLGCPSGPGSFL